MEIQILEQDMLERSVYPITKLLWRKILSNGNRSTAERDILAVPSENPGSNIADILCCNLIFIYVIDGFL